jgi:NAD(P)-dependent dehydrogenase (short-subunit alcohol dehydrogenase family)
VNGPLRLLDRFFVTGRVAIVSGSGRGIGAACARTLAEAGAHVVLVARTKADLDAVSAQAAQLGRRSLTIVGDLRDTANAAKVVERTLEAKIARTPLRRLGTPEDIALAVLFLASPASGYVTGEVLEVDGGIDGPNSPSILPDLLSM